MQQIPATKAKDQFGAILSTVRYEPVEITKRGEVVAVLLSSSQYENMGGNKARLKAVVKELRDQAKANGLTQEILADLLNEE